LTSQVEKQLNEGQNVVLDVDVKGGCNIKKHYKDKALSVFIQPPSIDELKKRLVSRGTDSAEVIEDRLAKAEFELSFAPQYDVVIVNDDIEIATKKAFDVIKSFINQ
jgi:guanylate kinase